MSCFMSLFIRGPINWKQMQLLSTPMGVDHVVIGFDMEVQPLVTHSAA